MTTLTEIKKKEEETLKVLAEKTNGVYEGPEIAYTPCVEVTRDRDGEQATVGYNEVFGYTFIFPRLGEYTEYSTEKGVLNRIEKWKNERIRTDA